MLISIPLNEGTTQLQINKSRKRKRLFGTIVNTLAIIVGSLAGLAFGRGIPEKYSRTVIHSISLAIILIGLKGALETKNLLLVIFSLAIGSVVGEFLRIEDRLENIGKWLEIKFSKAGEGISKGFVTASLVFCVGSMAIVGSLESGLTGNHQILFAKSVLDGISSIVFASLFGGGVLLSSVSVLIYQGLITVTASFMEQFLTEAVVNQMSAIGGLLIMAIGFNMLEIKKLKVANMLPSILMPLLYFIIVQVFHP
jgi:uncharacterized membrane protein YqgA involved in biofilm formation